MSGSIVSWEVAAQLELETSKLVTAVTFEDFLCSSFC